MENQIQSLNLTNIIESLIFASDKPLTAEQIYEIVNTPCEDTGKIEAIKNSLIKEALPNKEEENVASKEDLTEETTEEETQEEPTEDTLEASSEENDSELENEEETAEDNSIENLETQGNEQSEGHELEASAETDEVTEDNEAPEEGLESKEQKKEEECEETTEPKIEALFSIEDVKESLEIIKSKYNTLRDTPINLCEIGDAYQLRTNPAYGKFIRNLKIAKPVKLTKSALETLAILAYKQPITRTEIDAIRGVDSGYCIRFLSEKKLCKILGKKDIPGRPILYGTTDEFLSLFSLKNLSSLPTIREFKELTEKHNEKVNDLFEQPTMEELKSDVSEIQRFSETDDENIAEIDQALSESRKVKTVEKILAHEIMQDPPEEGEEGAEGAEESESLENSEHTDEGLKAQDGAENEEETAEETLQESTEELTPDYEALNEDDEELHETEIEREDVVEAYTAPIENNEDAQSMSDDPGTEDSDEVSDSDLYDKETLDSIEKTFEDEEDPQEDEMLAENVESAQETDETTDEPEITG